MKCNKISPNRREEKEKKAAVPAKTGWFSATSRLFQAVIDVALWQFLQSIWDGLCGYHAAFTAL